MSHVFLCLFVHFSVNFDHFFTEYFFILEFLIYFTTLSSVILCNSSVILNYSSVILVYASVILVYSSVTLVYSIMILVYSSVTLSHELAEKYPRNTRKPAENWTISWKVSDPMGREFKITINHVVCEWPHRTQNDKKGAEKCRTQSQCPCVVFIIERYKGCWEWKRKLFLGPPNTWDISGPVELDIEEK